jgi:RNA polymerase primary sigma factor
MKQKYEGKDLQSLVELGREQGYLTFDQVNDFLPQDVSSPTDLRSALESFQDMDIKILTDVPEGELEAEGKDGPTRPPSPRRPLIRSASRRIPSASI